ncbi:MAG: c-type cytochrome [Deltaproteobacteria bacterium]|nr:c-type cytochrome [Deltaproteobacteria bacterium]
MKEENIIKPNNKEVVIGTIAAVFIALGLLLYALYEPQRIDNAQKEQLSMDLRDAMVTFAKNCTLCHGMAGEGIGSNPPLNTPALRESDSSALTKTISRGLFKTAMPAWSKEDGGPLSDYQIGQLVRLIRFGDWQETKQVVAELGLTPLTPFAAVVDPKIIEELKRLEGGDVLAKGVTLFAEKCVACHGADGLGTALAPALNDPKVREKPVDDIKRTLLLGKPGTLMAGWENILSSEQSDALIRLIKEWDRVPAGSIPIPQSPIVVTKELLAKGEKLYAANCSQCHGPDGQGRGRRIPSLNVKGFLTKTNDAALEQIITLGVPETPMPAWGDRMTKEEIQSIVGFIRSWEPTAPEMAEPVRGGPRGRGGPP